MFSIEVSRGSDIPFRSEIDEAPAKKGQKTVRKKVLLISRFVDLPLELLCHHALSPGQCLCACWQVAGKKTSNVDGQYSGQLTLSKLKTKTLPKFASCTDRKTIKVLKQDLKKCKPWSLEVARALF